VSREASAVFLLAPYFSWPRASIGSGELNQVSNCPEPDSLEPKRSVESAPLWGRAQRGEEDREELIHPRHREPGVRIGFQNTETGAAK
jgi:hypothetical protein